MSARAERRAELEAAIAHTLTFDGIPGTRMPGTEALELGELAELAEKHLVPPGVRIYDREMLVQVLIWHQRKDSMSCACGWSKLAASHAEHIADVYERSEASGGVER